jgi:hypothetical protein
MKLKSARYNAIVHRPNHVERNSLSDEIDIRKQELNMMTGVIREAIKQKKEVCHTLFELDMYKL